MNGKNLKKAVAVLIGLGVIAAVIALLAGGHGGGQSTATAKRNFCDSLSSLSSTVTAYHRLGPRTTNDQIKRETKNVENAWNKVDSAASDWARTSGNATAQAYKNLGHAVAALPGNDTIAQDMQTLSAFPRAYKQAFNGSGCRSA